jgi:hypothetical protein
VMARLRLLAVATSLLAIAGVVHAGESKSVHVELRAGWTVSAPSLTAIRERRSTRVRRGPHRQATHRAPHATALQAKPIARAYGLRRKDPPFAWGLGRQSRLCIHTK